MEEPAARIGGLLSFGPFTLAASERLLLRAGAPVELGARALDVLIVLASHPNEIISKQDLLARVWPDVIVEEGSLRFHIANLRKALGDGRDGARYIATLPGRGYCFVAAVSVSAGQIASPAVAAGFPQANLPSRLTRMIGRDEDARQLSSQLLATRFVTIVGSGGVGKTTLAVAIGHDLVAAFAGAAHFVDLGALSDPRLLTTTIASMLGLSVHSDDATPGLIAYLADKRILLILDTCEHVIEAAAALAARIFAATPQVHILATSREPLRVEGEHVCRLAPLACPPDDPELEAASAQDYPAAQLFVERALASGARLALDDAEAAVVGRICRRLDGVPLAIELAAGRVGGLGLQETAALLDQRLTLMGPGQRTAPQRQKTLQATLDWSYRLLSEVERVVLRRLAVFVGQFTLKAALEVVTCPVLDQGVVFSTLDGLVAKSMVATRPTGAMMRYRLLDTTRAYALETVVDDSRLEELGARHAAYYLRWLGEAGAEWPALSDAAQRSLRLAGLSNVRAALEWCFGPGGDIRTGVALAAAAAPAFLAMSLLTECHRWSERAIGALDDVARGRGEEMHLQTTLGISLMFTRGGKDAARRALSRGFSIAEGHGTAVEQLQVLAPLQMFHLRTAGFKLARHYAERCSAIARGVEDSAAATTAHAVMGISLHLGGEHEDARRELEAALRRGPASRRSTRKYLGFEARDLAGALLARTLWLQGYPEQAVERAQLTVREAAGTDHSLTLSIAIVWVISLFLWTGDLESADKHADSLVAHAGSHDLGPHLVLGRAFKGDLAIRRGDAGGGVETLQDCLRQLHAAPYELLTTPLNISLVQGLAASGRLGEALSLLEETLRAVEAGGDLCYLPELLRVKGNLLLAEARSSAEEAEACYRRSLDLSRRQGARGWELRGASDLAALLASRGQPEAGRALLQPIFGLFLEGAETVDLQVAGRLLAALGDGSALTAG